MINDVGFEGEEIMSIEFVVDKVGFYKTREGKKEEVICLDGTCVSLGLEFPVITRSGNVFTKSGRYNHEDDDELDLIAHWRDEPEYEDIPITSEGGGDAHFEGRVHSCAVSVKGFCGYVYNIDGKEILSALPCGWILNGRIVSDCPPKGIDEPIRFPIAWRRMK